MSKYYVYKNGITESSDYTYICRFNSMRKLDVGMYLVNKNLRRVTQDAENFLCR